MKKLLAFALFLAMLLSVPCFAGVAAGGGVYAYSDPNWQGGTGATADGLWRYEWFARETSTFAPMQWNASGAYYEAQFQTAAASDTHWYCRVRSNGTNLHPGAQADATMTFVAPQDGEIRLTVNLARQSAPNPNGNTVRVMVNDKIIPIQGAEDYLLDTTDIFALDVTATVKKGDLVRLMIGSQGNSSADGVNFNGLTVQYLGGNGGEALPSYTIACVGDSITEGMGTSGGLKGANAFPSVLQGLLNKTGVANYKVENYGKSATTALVKGDRPYKQSAEYKMSKQSKPDVVIICLGANDSKATNWNADQYEVDYQTLIEEYMEMETKPIVYLFYTTYVADQSKTGCRRDVIQNEIMPIQDIIAKDLGLKIIDLNTLTKNNAEKYADGVHPNDQLQGMMAEYIFNALCSEKVLGLSDENATAKVTMIDHTPKPPVSTDTQTDVSSTVTDTNSNDIQAPVEKKSPVLWICLGAAAVVLIGVVAVLFLRKKK